MKDQLDSKEKEMTKLPSVVESSDEIKNSSIIEAKLASLESKFAEIMALNSKKSKNSHAGGGAVEKLVSSLFEEQEVNVDLLMKISV